MDKQIIKKLQAEYGEAFYLLDSAQFRKNFAELKAAFNDYRDLNTDLRNELEELGFEISSEGKHHKLTYYGDSRYQTTLAKTSSDYRSGMNAVSVIIKNMM